jgi:hypothetical protein
MAQTALSQSRAFPLESGLPAIFVVASSHLWHLSKNK